MKALREWNFVVLILFIQCNDNKASNLNDDPVRTINFLVWCCPRLNNLSPTYTLDISLFVILCIYILIRDGLMSASSNLGERGFSFFLVSYLF